MSLIIALRTQEELIIASDKNRFDSKYRCVSNQVNKHAFNKVNNRFIGCVGNSFDCDVLKDHFISDPIEREMFDQFKWIHKFIKSNSLDVKFTLIDTESIVSWDSDDYYRIDFVDYSDIAIPYAFGMGQEYALGLMYGMLDAKEHDRFDHNFYYYVISKVYDRVIFRYPKVSNDYNLLNIKLD